MVFQLWEPLVTETTIGNQQHWHLNCMRIYAMAEVKCLGYEVIVGLGATMYNIRFCIILTGTTMKMYEDV